MRRLGYNQYGVQGGDWGHAVTLQLAAVDPEHMVGIHLKTLLTLPPTDSGAAATLDDTDRSRLQRLVTRGPTCRPYGHPGHPTADCGLRDQYGVGEGSTGFNAWREVASPPDRQ